MRLGTRAAVSIGLMLAAGLGAPAAAGAQEPAFAIAFQSDRDGNDSELWLVSSTGGEERPLTSNDTPDAAPSWSPDGAMIVYACAPRSAWDVCTIDPATGEVTELTRTGIDEFDPRYTADGSHIVFETYPQGRKADIAIMPAAGGVPKPLVSTPATDEQDPAPSPVSSKIAFAPDGNIAVLDAASPTLAVTLVTRGSRGDTDPTFSSRDQIAFARPRAAGRLDIVRAGRERPSGRRSVQRLTVGKQDDIQPAWTVDGTEVFFARAREARRGLRIFRMTAGGLDVRAVTAGGAYDDTNPAPQPLGGAPAAAQALYASTALPGGPLRGPWRATALVAAAAAEPCQGHKITKGTNKSNKKLVGTSGEDCIYGRAGKDTLTGNGGSDRLYGGPGSDTVHATDDVQDFISGGQGADLAHIDNGLDVYKSTAID